MNNPLILVFYLDREMMANKQIFLPFSEYVNNILVNKSDNAIAFFIPTDGEERIECINPTIVKEADMDKINKMVEDIKTIFSVGIDPLPEHKLECDCGEYPKCKCGESDKTQN